jgi:hypothetical protein
MAPLALIAIPITIAGAIIVGGIYNLHKRFFESSKNAVEEALQRGRDERPRQREIELRELEEARLPVRHSYSYRLVDN